jgi:hypothetical protein
MECIGDEFGVVEINEVFKESDTDSSRRSRVSRKINRDKVLFMLALGNGNDKPECIKCGFSDIRALQIDHVNGGGAIHYRQFKNNRPKYYKSMLDHLEDFQILCANCNTIKVIENKERYGTEVTCIW